jgi:hypothetical protein
MIVFGIVWSVVCSRLPGREPWVYGGEEGQGKPAAEKASERNRRRQLRKKLR